MCLFPRKHLTFQNLQEHLERLLAEENGSEDSRGRRYACAICASCLCCLIGKDELYHEGHFPE